MNNFKNLNELDFTKPRKNETLNPNWVTGFIDGEGSFIIALISSTGPTKKKSFFKIECYSEITFSRCVV